MKKLKNILFVSIAIGFSLAIFSLHQRNREYETDLILIKNRNIELQQERKMLQHIFLNNLHYNSFISHLVDNAMLYPYFGNDTLKVSIGDNTYVFVDSILYEVR